MDQIRAALLDRARDLAPVLAARADEAEVQRELSPETMEELTAAGFFHILGPQRHGGLELDFATLCGVARLLGRGCTSTAWVTAFFGIHTWIAAQLPEDGQDEVFAGRGYVLAPGTFAPTGRADRVEGGFVLRGRWAWATGVQHSTWAMVSCLVRDGDRAAMRMFVVPMADVSVVDTWHTSGMRATGSHDVVVDDVFVPAHRTVSFKDLVEGTAPGGATHPSDVYRWPMVPMLALSAAAAALGTAEAAAELFRCSLDGRVLAYSPGTRQRDRPAMQMRAARVWGDALAAGLLYDHALADLARVGADGAPYALTDRARLRFLGGRVVAAAGAIVDEVAPASGASSQFSSSPVQRFSRDIHTLSNHIAFDADVTAELHGQGLLGVEIPRMAML